MYLSTTGTSKNLFLHEVYLSYHCQHIDHNVLFTSCLCHLVQKYHITCTYCWMSITFHLNRSFCHCHKSKLTIKWSAKFWSISHVYACLWTKLKLHVFFTVIDALCVVHYLRTARCIDIMFWKKMNKLLSYVWLMPVLLLVSQKE